MSITTTTAFTNLVDANNNHESYVEERSNTFVEQVEEAPGITKTVIDCSHFGI